jgi:helicase MOV-10
MDLFQGLWRLIFGSQDERRDDHNVRNGNPVYENHPVNTTPPNFPRSRVILVTRGASVDQPNVGDSPTTNPKHIQELLERSNEVHRSSTSSSPFQSSYKPPQSSSSPSPSSSNSTTSSTKGLPSSSGPSQFPHNGPPTSSRPPPSSPSQTPAFKPILRMAPSDEINGEAKASYVLEKGSPIYAIPEDIKGLIKKDIVPAVLKQPLSPSTYKHYFAALLYAEDFYSEVLVNALRYCCL